MVATILKFIFGLIVTVLVMYVLRMARLPENATVGFGIVAAIVFILVLIKRFFMDED